MARADLDNCSYVLSPNTVNTRQETTLAVVSYSANDDYRSAVQWLTEKRAKRSVHFVIAENGDMTQMLPLDAVGWHAGRSVWRGKPAVNQYSIGIELVNLGPLLRRREEYVAVANSRVVPAERVFQGSHGTYDFWQTYPEQQLTRLRELGRFLRERFPTLREMVGYGDVSPGRRLDPGPAFPVDAFVLQS